MKVGIILAAGKGVRLNCRTRNKTSVPVKGIPMVLYGVSLFQKTVDKIIVVVGAYAESVKSLIKDKKIILVKQGKRLGTGHAARIAINYLKRQQISPDQVFIGYGDHLMFYTPEIVNKMSQIHQQKKPAITMTSTTYNNPNLLSWGRIIRDQKGKVSAIIEQKEATENIRKIKEVNPGFYCFNFKFLVKNLPKLKKSKLTAEYYLTDLVDLARKEGKQVVAYMVPFENVGPGINTPEHLRITEKMMKETKLEHE